ncbi:helix-turn-helix domain-containing protein [Streptomyces dubilierae]
MSLLLPPGRHRVRAERGLHLQDPPRAALGLTADAPQGPYRHAALSRTAAQLSAARGWSAVKVEDIAAAVGVSPRTYNNYFSSKTEAIAFRHLPPRLRRHRRTWSAVRRPVLTAAPEERGRRHDRLWPRHGRCISGTCQAGLAR